MKSKFLKKKHMLKNLNLDAITTDLQNAWSETSIISEKELQSTFLDFEFQEKSKENSNLYLSSEKNANVNSSDESTNIIIDYLDNSVNTEEEFSFLDDIEFDDLDSILDSDDFINEVNTLENPIDKRYNLDYLKQMKHTDLTKREKALHDLITANEKLVWKIAKRYEMFATTSFDLEDMFQAGMWGLLKAVEGFDFAKGIQFSTYATLWIQQRIQREISDFSTTIRIPVHLREKMAKLIKVENEIWNGENGIPTSQELSQRMNVSEEAIIQMQFFMKQSNIDSLDRQVGEDGDTYLSELVPDPNSKTPEAEAMETEIVEAIMRTFDKFLSTREKDILTLRFGLKNNKEHSLEEIGKRYELTRERIRQIEAKALRRLRLSKSELKEFIEYD